MTLKVTQKQVKETYGEKIISVPYCTWQSILRFFEPVAYNAGIYGWNFDLYDIGGWAIVTGYRTIQQPKRSYEYMHYLEETMQQYIIDTERKVRDYKEYKELCTEKAKNLIEEYIKEVMI